MTMYNLVVVTGCSGTIKVFGDTHSHSIITCSHKLIERKRTKRGIKKYNPESKSYLKFKYAKIEGDCIWKIHSKPPNIGGESKTFGRPGTYESTFEIQSVTLVIDLKDITEISTSNNMCGIDKPEIEDTNKCSMGDCNEKDIEDLPAYVEDMNQIGNEKNGTKSAGRCNNLEFIHFPYLFVCQLIVQQAVLLLHSTPLTSLLL